MSGFRKFLVRGNLVDLAVAVVVGTAFAAVVTALVKDLITPLIAAVGGKPNFENLYFMLNGSSSARRLHQFADLVRGHRGGRLLPGGVARGRLMDMISRKQAATERECPECLSNIPIGARKCMYCTTDLTPPR